jgi:hypothetical protein
MLFFANASQGFEMLFKESKVTTEKTMAGQQDESSKVSLDVLAKMTGFPVEIIKDELLKGTTESEISMEDLRAAMLSYIDSTMLMTKDR